MRVLILGSTGMLGNAVGKHFINTDHDVSLTYRTDIEYGNPDERIRFGVGGKLDWIHGSGYDYVINCIGTIKPFMKEDPRMARYVNAVFPWELSNHCEKQNINLIHITTDCVYSGRQGLYVESDPHDALDDYGKSKSLGEPDNCMVIRTSIIGEEIHKNASLIAWAKSQKGKEINGFTNHYWNGITTNQYAKICDQIINEGLWTRGLFHVFSKHAVTKYEMMHMFNKKYNLEMKINEFEAKESCDRSLSTEKELNAKLRIPDIKTQITEL